MTGIELTERFINDLEKFVLAKKIALSQTELRTQFSNSFQYTRINSEISLEISWISMNCEICIPYNLGDLSYFINYFETLVNYKSGDKVDLNIFLNQVKEKKEKISTTFQKIKETPTLMITPLENQQTLFSHIVQKFDEVHNDALSIFSCYTRIIDKAK